MITDDVKSMLTLEISDALDRGDRHDKLNAAERMAMALEVIKLFEKREFAPLIAYLAGVTFGDRFVLRLMKEVEES